MNAADDKTGIDSFDRVVVLMLENRSFDNMLGYLYHDGVPAGKKFEGLQDKIHSNPVPAYASGFNQNKTLATSRAADYSQPFPDPGEEYQHVNTQLFNTIDPLNNAVEAYKMKKPFNLPEGPLPSPAPMNGFISDYISNLQSSEGITDVNKVAESDYEVIMQCFYPNQLSVLGSLAKEFAVFDHWHCSVPSQTYCNRAFWHAGTSGGKVINPLEEHGGCFLTKLFFDVEGMQSWKKKVWSQPTLFNRMDDANVSSKIYSPIWPISLTTIIHGEFDKVHHFDDFFEDLKNENLPQYSFVEPQFLSKHNDQHPSAVKHELHPGTVLLGENLIAEVYNAIKNCSENYRDRILFVITYDEHGGCYDHYPPPPHAVPPIAGINGQKGFGFNRPGVRVPMVMISSHIEPNTIVNETFDHTSFIKTACKKWNLQPLTDRDKAVNVFTDSNLFTTQKRADWPEVNLDAEKLQKIKVFETVNTDYDPLNGLQKSMKEGMLFIEKLKGLEKTPKKSIRTIGQLMDLHLKLKENL